MASGNDTLSRRGAVYATPPNPMGNYKELPQDTYDPETNPTGFINIGTSDNVVISFSSGRTILRDDSIFLPE